jgi:triacylglycerol esterase/lipase EstA (alpha/beta hydrolase family)
MKVEASKAIRVGRATGSLIAAVALASATWLGLGIGAASANLVPNTQNTILLVHGFSVNSNTDCSGTWSQDISWLRSEGFTGSMVKIGYYTGDTNCDVNLHNYGSYGDQDSWKSIAAAFSKYVSGTYTSKGVTVDIIGYSMGGLVTRGAVYGAQSGAAGFSGPINVSDAVTLGTPHNGAAWYASGCFWSAQCQSMVQGSTDLNWLNQNGNPQGSAGTTWTVMGSHNDDVVPDSSAIYMSVPIDHQIVWDNISHTGACCHPSYLQSWDVANRTSSALGTKPGAVHSGISSAKCVDVQHSNPADGTPVQIYDCNGTGAQVWTHMYNGKTVLTALGKCLDISGANGSPGTKVQLWTCNTGSNQEWTIGSDHSLRSLGYCLDDPNSNIANSTQLQIWTCNGTNAQKWYFG